MSLFVPKFFQTRPNRSFEYKPRYYDQDKERLENMKKKYSQEGDSETAAGYKARIKDEFRAQRPTRKTSGVLRRPVAFLVGLFLLIILIWILK